MFPNVYQMAVASQAVTNLLGPADDCKFYDFGQAPDQEAAPYAVWQFIGGSPYNCMSNVPSVDSQIVQIDCYSTEASISRAVAKALRDALEIHGYVESWRGESRDIETQLYRFSFDVRFITYR